MLVIFSLVLFLMKNTVFLRFQIFFFCTRRDKVVDFHWNAYDPWTIVSVSDDCGSTGGGGTLQVISQDLHHNSLCSLNLDYSGRRVSN